MLFRHPLYQLSYVAAERPQGFEPCPPGWRPGVQPTTPWTLEAPAETRTLLPSVRRTDLPCSGSTWRALWPSNNATELPPRVSAAGRIRTPDLSPEPPQGFEPCRRAYKARSDAAERREAPTENRTRTAPVPRVNAAVSTIGAYGEGGNRTHRRSA
jgi:hypothetical protein